MRCRVDRERQAKKRTGSPPAISVPVVGSTGAGKRPAPAINYSFGSIDLLHRGDGTAARDKTSVSGFTPAAIDQRLRYGKSAMADDLLGRILGMLAGLDEKLKGSARQSWGWIIYGTGTGRGGPGAAISPGGKVAGTFDYALFTRYLDLFLSAVPESSAREQLESLRKDLDARRLDDLPQHMYEARHELEEIAEESHRRHRWSDDPNDMWPIDER
jgi:hypothetical protein